MENNNIKLIFYNFFHIFKFSYSHIQFQISIININVFGNFMLDLLVDMHGQDFGVPLKDQDPSLKYNMLNFTMDG
jgi:hypothetical protein